MDNTRFGYTDPKETLRRLIIYKSTLESQLKYLPFGTRFTALRRNARYHLALVDYYIEDYRSFFEEKRKKEFQLSLFDKNN